MTPFLVVLVSIALGLWIRLAILRSREVLLKAKEQAFRFHEIRDRLQILNVQGKIEETSVGYKFLMSSLNMAIKNAGTMRLSDVLKISRAVRKNADDIRSERIDKDIRRHGEEARKLSAEFFQALAVMLVSNDNLTSIMFALAMPLAGILNQAALRLIASTGKVLAPDQTEALYEAREYQRWGKALAPSY